MANIYIITALLAHGCVPNPQSPLDGFMGIIQSLGQISPIKNSNDDNTTKEEKYDFIIIGSGPSGSVLANRLSEVPHWNVLLLEAGDEPSLLTDIPILAAPLQFTNYSWGYFAEKEETSCLGCPGRRMRWPHGKVLGGSSVINFMIHVRGSPLDYDRWAAMGNPGWSYEEVLPYFLKSEDAHLARADAGYHQTGGYLSYGDVPFRTKSAHVFVRAAQEAGLPYVDYNGKHQIGVSYMQATLRNGRRCSAEKAFLRPARDRKNLKILTKARALRILIEPETKRAYGVEYVKDRKRRKAIASKEVLLSAGGLNSPQLLMLSGIGPKDHLEELEIPLIQDLPVGRKMYDHITFVGLPYQLNESIGTNLDMMMAPMTFLRFVIDGDGPLSMPGCEAIGYFKTNASDDQDPSYPDVEILFSSTGISFDKGLVYRRLFSISQDIYDKIFKPLEDKQTIQIFPVLMHPKSHGYIKLKSKNPFHWPKFYGQYFTDPENQDIKTFIAAIRFIQKIGRSPSLQKYGARPITTPIPGCETHSFDSDGYWECALRHITPTLYHQLSTCKMGPTDDPEAVVDPRLRVFGIENLRVIDTSVIPLPLTAHTAVPAYMVGEKAADMIKEDWKAIK